MLNSGPTQLQNSYGNPKDTVIMNDGPNVSTKMSLYVDASVQTDDELIKSSILEENLRLKKHIAFISKENEKLREKHSEHESTMQAIDSIFTDG
ncbi:hypothetical protein CVS40_11132 [Lucilia cuprina]|nr:hypothetical protein CVS40_11132 [Lucilia cuprina]